MATTTVDNRRETVSLIGSDKVEGTPVYGRDDNKIGTVQRVMLIEKDRNSSRWSWRQASFSYRSQEERQIQIRSSERPQHEAQYRA